MSKLRVLFLCTGNSCRSQIAEAVVNHDLAETWQAFSAGTQPAGYVHPLALKALSEVGIEHHGESKSLDVFYGQPFHLVVTLCDDAEQNCPVWLGKGARAHIGFLDPAKTEGTEQEKLAAFRQTLGDIRAQIIPFLKNFEKEQ